MPNIDVRQPEIVAIEAAYEPGDVLDFNGDSSDIVERMQANPYDDEFAIISGLARVSISPLEVEYTDHFQLTANRKWCQIETAG